MRLRNSASLLWCFWATWGMSQAGNILMWLEVASTSHFELWKPLMASLLQREHHITIILPFDYTHGDPHPNVTHIRAGGVIGDMLDSEAVFAGRISFFYALLTEHFKKSQEDVFNSPITQRLIQGKPKFDVALANAACIGIGVYISKAILKVPLILVLSGRRTTAVDMIMGNPVLPSFMPDFFLPYSPEMRFHERLINSVVTFLVPLGFQLRVDPIVGGKLKDLFHLKTTPDLSALAASADFAFQNGHPIFELAVPMNPNTALIGGIHCRPPKPLPEKLKQWLDEADHGAILFSSGSILKSKDLPKEIKRAIINAFSRLEQRIIWKWEEDHMPEKPDNVMVAKWVPQQDVLGHPNLKVFITHGGMLSIMEAVYHKVPLLVLPGFGDQQGNAARCERMGHGLALQWRDLNEHTLFSKLTELLENETFASRAARYGDLLQDNVVASLDKAVFYTEFLMRHKGAPFLRSAAEKLSWFQYFLLDVIAFVFLVTALIIYLVIRAISYCRTSFAGDSVKLKQN